MRTADEQLKKMIERSDDLWSKIDKTGPGKLVTSESLSYTTIAVKLDAAIVDALIRRESPR